MSRLRALGSVTLRAVRGVARAAGTFTLVVVAIVASLLTQLNTPVAHRVTMARVNQLAFEPLFQGTMVILAIGHVDPLGGVTGVRVRVDDPSGQPVLLADGIAGRINLVKLLSSLASPASDILVDLPFASIDQVDLRLDLDDRGLALGNAFFIKPSPTPSPPDTGPGKGVRVSIPAARIKHAWIHGLIPGAPYFDSDVSDLDAAFALDDKGLAADLRKASVVARGIALGHDAEGTLDGRFEMALDGTAAMGGRAAWKGRAGLLPETLSASLLHGQFDAVVDVPEATPEALRSILPTATLGQTGALHAEAHGPLDAIVLAAHATAGPASLDVDGPLRWGTDKGARVHIVAKEVDLAQIVPSAPPSDLGVVADVTLALSPDGRLEGQAVVDLPAGKLSGEKTPRVTFETSGFRAPGGAFGGDAALIVEEPGAPTTITLHAVPRGGSSNIAFTIASRAVHIGAVRRLGADATGSLHVLGHGQVDLEKLAVDVSVSTEGHGLARGDLHVGAIAVSGSAHGSLLNPTVDLRVHGEGLGWGGRTIDQVDATARGRALSPRVTVHARSADVPDVDAEADVALLEGPTVRNADVWIRRKGEAAHVRADRVRVREGQVTVDAATIEGLGAPVKLAGTVGGTSGRLKADARRVDLGRVARLAMLEGTLHAGILALEADGTYRRGEADGTLHATVEHAALLGIDDLSAHVDGRAQGRRFVGTAGAKAADIGSVEIDTKGLSVGAIGDGGLATLRKAYGDVELTGKVDLAKLAQRLPRDSLPVSTMGGTVDVKARFQRDNASDYTPLLELTATSSGLLLQGKKPPTPTKQEDAAAPPASPPAPPSGSPAATANAARDAEVAHPPPAATPPPWTLEGVDVETSLRVRGDTGALELGVKLRDAKGSLAVASLRSASVPYRELYDAPAQALAAVGRAPFSATLSLPRRAVASWPRFFGRPPVDGDLEAEITVEGPLDSPHVAVTAGLSSVLAAGARLTAPLDLHLRAGYDGHAATAELRGGAGPHELLAVDAQATVALADFFSGVASPAWTAACKGKVDGFPLIAIGALDDRQIRGHLKGDFEVTDLHKDAHAKVALALSDLKVGDAEYTNATATLLADGKQVAVNVAFAEDQGSLSAKAVVPATWGAALLPVPDAKGALAIDVVAKHFRAAVVRPFLRGTIDELDGLIDAELHASVDPTTRAVHLQGGAEVKEGLLEVGAFGGELHDISGRLKVAPDGLVTLEDVTAYGVSGVVMASAKARLDGLRLQSANATVQIPKARALPLSVNGALVGSIDGRLDITEAISADRKSLDVKIDIPTLHLLAPEAGSQDVQALGPIQGVTVGLRRTPTGVFVEASGDADDVASETKEARPEDALAVHVTTHLGNDVSIRRGSDVKVELTGGPVITVTDKTHVTGQIQLKSGVLNLYGKNFAIERGTVSFVGDDPSNPQVSVTAEWTASDGTQVYADFIGPLKTGKVTLRSEPSLAKNDILQLILFGAVDDTQAAAQGVPGASSAEGVAGNVAAQPLNRALDQFGLSAVSAKVDTSSVNPKPEVAVQVAKDISLQLARVLYIGPPPPGSSPDTLLFTIDWRFLRKWSLDATVGNAGSTIVDLVWKYRY